MRGRPRPICDLYGEAGGSLSNLYAPPARLGVPGFGQVLRHLPGRGLQGGAGWTTAALFSARGNVRSMKHVDPLTGRVPTTRSANSSRESGRLSQSVWDWLSSPIFWLPLW